MTIRPSEARREESGAVAVEWIASTAAAIGLSLCLLVAQGGEPGFATGPLGHDVEEPR